MRVGETFQARFEVRNTAGALATPDTAVVTVTRPDGTTLAPIMPTESSTGVMDWQFTPAAAGMHRYVARVTLGGVTRDLAADVVHVDDAASAVPLVSLGEAKAHLNKSATVTADDDELRRFILSASELVEQETRLWHRATVVERLVPATPLFLGSLPVVSVTSVVQGATTFDPGTYRLDPIGALWPAYGASYPPWAYTASVDDVVVTYEAGETVVPAAVREAVLLTLADAWETQRGPAGLPLSDTGDSGDLLPRSSWTLPPEAMGKLSRWLKGPVLA